MVVIANPKPSSFVHAMAHVAQQGFEQAGHVAWVHDLYVEGFDPVLRADEAATFGVEAESVGEHGDALVMEHRRHLAAADVLVVAHPNWWGKPPAIMAGWIDRVIVPGVAYRLPSGEGEPEPLLHLRRLMVLNTSDTPAEREAAVFGDPLEAIWRRCVGTYLGEVTFDRLVAGPIASSTPADRRGWLDEVAAISRAAGSVALDGD
jgi:putative NADPH-quinone reductase